MPAAWHRNDLNRDIDIFTRREAGEKFTDIAKLYKIHPVRARTIWLQMYRVRNAENLSNLSVGDFCEWYRGRIDALKAQAAEIKMDACTRTCIICGSRFTVSSKEQKGTACSKICRAAHMRQVHSGKKRSPEARKKLAEANSASWADPKSGKRRRAAVRAGIIQHLSNPENAAAASKRSSDRMKLRHADPDFQKRRNERSSRVMKANWDKYRDEFTQQSADRYQRYLELGVGIASDDSKQRKALAAKWIMTKAQEALHAETNYDVVFTEVQERLRREIPYDGPMEGSDYYEYCQKLGRAVVNSSECRTIADTFLGQAIPRFAKEWRERKADEAGEGKA